MVGFWIRSWSAPAEVWVVQVRTEIVDDGVKPLYSWTVCWSWTSGCLPDEAAMPTARTADGCGG